jgi:hypothetical protein
LHEKRAQVTIAAHGDAPEDGSVSGRLGTSPIQGEKSRPLAKAAPLPIAATIALEMIGPMPGTVITLRQLSSLFANVSISSVTPSIRSSSCRQSLVRSATMRTSAWLQTHPLPTSSDKTAIEEAPAAVDATQITSQHDRAGQQQSRNDETKPITAAGPQ